MFAGVVLGLASIAAGSAWAQAKPASKQDLPAPMIGVIDVQKVLAESKAGKGLRPQVEKMTKTINDAEQKAIDDLRAKERQLNEQRTLLAPEAFNDRQKALRDEALSVRRVMEARKADAQEAIQNARNKVIASLQKVAVEIAKEKSLNLILPKSQVFVVANVLEITPLALAALDQELPSVNLTASAPKRKQ